MVTLDQTVTPEAWDAIAKGYDELVTPANSTRIAEEALEHLGIGSGQRFLDVACGTGALALAAARRGADVLGVDFAPKMIEYLEARARAEGASNLEGRVMDGHALELDDDSFDASGSQFGVMLFPDLPRGMREMVRVTKPGGTVLVVAFGPPPKAEFLTFFIGAVQSVVPEFTGPPPDEPLLPFQAADPEVLAERMTEAGLHDVRIEQTVGKLEFDSGDQMWDWMMNSNPIPGALTSGLTDEQRAEVRRVLDGMLRERSGGTGPAVVTAAVNIGLGTK